ncbi:ExeM/NucH family extracellular endonuclease [Nocardioides piscis]|uniref:ExeM/NucH family extracellular endonuclease n=1 Tax=Nocardioides piscis TaxID=2714938 RepID=UPI001981059C|nr:ExeM/NucH family extracellular endonuclease [Nocardioides piscis]
MDVQILGTNDFHGRLLANGAEAGAAQFAGAVAQLRAENPNTLFAAGGDLIGASTFESFIQKDKPTLDALNAAGLDVSAAGNHEFDAGYRDLVDRVMAPYDAASNELGGAEWQYLAANVRRKSDGAYALPDVAASPGDSDGGTWMTSVGDVQVGFVGTVTEELSSLVSPAGISEVEVSGIVEETNAAADALTAAGADLVVMLVHEGATSTNIAAVTDDSAFGRIVAGVDQEVDAIISGHTHLAYDHVVDGRPVVSAGQYGTNLNKLVFSVDPVTGAVALKEHAIVAANSVQVTAPSAVETKAQVQALVKDATDKAEVLGARELGQLAGPLRRAQLASGSENRGGESTLGNLVAEVQRWATSSPESGGAQIGFMNPGGLRADMLGNNADGYPAVLTYKQAAGVQPFANNLVNMRMTGAQVKAVLEQQWQRDAAGNVPSRPFLRLGTSSGFRFTYDPARVEGDRITGMWLNGTAIAPATTYSVTANAFLAAGGDNFRAFGAATNKRDTGKIDLQAMVDYMAAKSPVAADPTQHAVGVSFPANAPAGYFPADKVRFNLSSLAFSAPGDVRDDTVRVLADGALLGEFPVDNTVGSSISDEYGTAQVAVDVPASWSNGKHVLEVVGNRTGTTVQVPVTAARPIAEIQGTGSSSPVSGQTVTTRGVVTARYETGGYNGFVIQTPGATPGAASHGLFVYGGSGAAGAARAGLVEIGDYVRVTGRVSEFSSLTQITPATSGDIQQIDGDVALTPAAVPFPTDNPGRERLEHMLLQPTGPFTVSDNYNLNRFGEMVLAAGAAPLRQPTDVARPGSSEAVDVAAQNAARRVVLDDGSTSDYVNHEAAQDVALPYLTDTPTLRVGDPVSFADPVILSYGFNEWRFQPQTQVTGGDGDSPATFGPSSRTAAPRAVGGDVQVASFNVLNYFPTTGDQLEGCDYYEDRDGDPVSISGGCDARGAAEREDFERQQAKIVRAINALDAEVVSLEEIENSAQFLRDRDRALADLVGALNADLGAQVWAYVKSPTLTPTVQREDFIRTGFIYKPAAVKAQGESVIYDGPEFDRARDPLAQVFKPVGGTAADKFLLVVNHFKSKGSPPKSPDPDADYGQGGFNALRVTQAQALVKFADELSVSSEVEKVYLDGDFNSYTFEDPMKVLYDAGYASLGEAYGASPTYVFGGMVGSLDHALANPAALASTTGADVWNINSVESVAHEYSRHNYNVTQFYAETPYRSSDHDPLVFGVDVR